MKPLGIDSYSDLQQYLSGFSSWDDADVYDSGGVAGLLAAILKNIVQHSDHHIIDDLVGYLSHEELKLVIELAAAAQRVNQ